MNSEIQDRTELWDRPNALFSWKALCKFMQQKETWPELCLFYPEEAKKMAVKEEKYDPGYEAAYGGAYDEKTAADSEQCNFPSNGAGRVWRILVSS